MNNLRQDRNYQHEQYLGFHIKLHDSLIAETGPLLAFFHSAILRILWSLESKVPILHSPKSLLYVLLDLGS